MSFEKNQRDGDNDRDNRGGVAAHASPSAAVVSLTQSEDILFFKRLQTDKLLKLLYVICPNDARTIYTRQQTQSKMRDFALFMQKYKLKLDNTSHISCLADVHAAVDQIKALLRHVLHSAQHLCLLATRFMSGVRRAQRFIRVRLAALRQIKEQILQRWAIVENNARIRLSKEIGRRTGGLMLSKAQSFIVHQNRVHSTAATASINSGGAGGGGGSSPPQAVMTTNHALLQDLWQLYLDCWSCEKNKRQAIGSCWQERKQTYIRHYRNYRARMEAYFIRGEIIRGSADDTRGCSQDRSGEGQAHRGSQQRSEQAPKEPPLPPLPASSWARRVALQQALRSFPPMSFDDSDVTLRELCAHLQLSSLKEIADAIASVKPMVPPNVVDIAPRGSTSVMQEAQALISTIPTAVGDVEQLPAIVSYYHALLVLDPAENIITLLKCRELIYNHNYNGGVRSSDCRGGRSREHQADHSYYKVTYPPVGEITKRHQIKQAVELFSHWHLAPTSSILSAKKNRGAKIPGRATPNKAGSTANNNNTPNKTGTSIASAAEDYLKNKPEEDKVDSSRHVPAPGNAGDDALRIPAPPPTRSLTPKHLLEGDDSAVPTSTAKKPPPRRWLSAAVGGGRLGCSCLPSDNHSRASLGAQPHHLKERRGDHLSVGLLTQKGPASGSTSSKYSVHYFRPVPQYALDAARAEEAALKRAHARTDHIGLRAGIPTPAPEQFPGISLDSDLHRFGFHPKARPAESAHTKGRLLLVRTLNFQ